MELGGVNSCINYSVHHLHYYGTSASITFIIRNSIIRDVHYKNTHKSHEKCKRNHNYLTTALTYETIDQIITVL